MDVDRSTGRAGRMGSTGGGLRSLAVVAAGIGLLVVLAGAAVFALGSPRLASFPPGTPEAAFQRYVAAVDAGDAVTARSFLSSQALSSGGYFPSSRGDAERRVWIDSVDRTSENAVQVHFTVEQTYQSGGLSLSTYRMSGTVSMVRENGEWKLASVPYEL